jgi:hypothetical protein
MSKFNPSTNIFTNWNKDMYIANKDGVTSDIYNNEIVVYKEPFYLGKVNYQPLTTKQLEAYIQAYGETENNVVSCLIDYKYKDTIKIFDLAYLYGATPENEVKYGENANYKVRAFKPQNTKIMMILEEIVKEEENNEERES